MTADRAARNPRSPATSDAAPASPNASVLIALAILVLALWAYLPALRAGWIWDDDLFVTNNGLVKSPGGLWDIWFGFYRDASKGGALVVKSFQYYPLVYSSFWLEHRLFGLDPTAYHALNVILHLVNATLVFRLARRLKIPGAALVAGLFAVHPMMVESVAWVSERKNVLSALFYFSAFLAYLRFDDRRQPVWYATSFVLFLGALLSKTVTATLPCALVLAVFWRRGTIRPRDVAYVLPFVVVGAGLGALSAHLERYAVGAYRAEFGQTFFERCALIAPRAFGFYALKTIWPHPITFIYPRFDPRVSDVLGYLWLAADVAAAVALFAARRTVGIGPLLLLLFSAVTLAPALGFVPVFPHRYSWVADHFAYLGSLGFFALIACGGAWLARRVLGQRGAILAAGAILVSCAALSHVAATSYHDQETLWTDTLAESPDAWIAMINLGAEYLEKTPATDEQMARALELFQRAERYDLARVQALTNQGLWYKRRRDFETAADLYRRARVLDPRRTRTRQLLAELRFEQARVALAEGRRGDALDACLAGMKEVGIDPGLMRVCGPLVSLSR